MKFDVFVSLCVLGYFSTDVQGDHRQNRRESRKLFGGYRITPRYCKPTRPQIVPLGGPNICMFNHECRQKEGKVVGACMDGFIFGTCCQLPQGISIGEYLDEDVISEYLTGNNISTKRPSNPPVDITSLGVSQIAESLLHPDLENNVQFSTSNAVQTESDNQIFQYISPTDEKTTLKTEIFPSTSVLGLFLSNAPIEYTTTSVLDLSRPIFNLKPVKPNNNFIRVPTITHNTSSNNKIQDGGSQTEVYITSRKPPSTSYVFSTTIPPKRTKRPSTKATLKPSTTFVSSTTKTTWAYSPSAFVTSSKPPSTSYVYSSLPPRRPPPSTISSNVDTPTFSISSNSVPSIFSTPAPTIIVLGPVPTDTETKRPIPSTYQQFPATIQRPTAYPQRKPSKPVNHVTINQHLVQNIYSTSSARPLNTQDYTERPSPTVLITPKPSISPFRPPDYSDTVEVATMPSSTNDLINFPPDRNPNLNMSHIQSINENDITTPDFVEDDTLNVNVESFVNKIIEGLQEPFQGLKDVLNNKKNISLLPVGTTTKRPPLRLSTATKRPVISTLRPDRVTTTQRPVTTTNRLGNRRTTTLGTTRKPNNATKKTKSTKKPVTVTQSFIEHQTEHLAVDPEDYRTECGIRPLVRSAKIVGGKGAIFGEFPWQVLVRESTWLGLFTKNKCGGVLISHKYVMTAAHCQPGFLASLVAVFGEFDISGDLEKRKPISRNVKRVIVHRQYDAQTFENDLALLELDQPVQFDQHIIPICLPNDEEDFTGRMATVTGWGRLKYGGGVPSVLQEVKVPIMENHVCQEMFRTAGHSKIILESFLCAGYANGQKDSCEGDSGGPLVLQRLDGRYQLAGTVSHGIKCAAPYLPGVYMRTAYFKPWITSITGVTSP